MGIFAPEGKLAAVLNRLGDLMVLNILTILCCLPVITTGAAVTAMYSVTLKMVKNEEGRIVNDYFRAFKSNFRQATVLWAFCGAVLFLVGLDFYILKFSHGIAWTVYRGILLAVFLFAGIFLCFVFPVLARFVNTTRNTAKNAALFAVIHPLQSLLMFVTMLLPLILAAISLRFLFAEALLGISGPAFLTSIYYRHLFEKFEVCENA